MRFKYTYFLLALVLSGIYGFELIEQAAEVLNTCDSKTIKKRCKEMLEPDYEYDSVKSTMITFKDKKQFKEIEVPLYIGEKYRFTFSKEGLPQDIDVEVYNRKYEAKKRSLLWSSKNEDGGLKEYVFHPTKSGKMYIDYLIPETTDTVKKGCVVFALGFQIK